LLEAMAAGTPIVCSSLDAFAKVAGDVATFAEPGDVEGLAAALRKALGDGERSGVEAGRRQAEGYDWKRLARALEEVFDSAARGAPPGPDGKR
jgi:glycosyltransferase involved in cell wall biosynthesis